MWWAIVFNKLANKLIMENKYNRLFKKIGTLLLFLFNGHAMILHHNPKRNRFRNKITLPDVTQSISLGFRLRGDDFCVKTLIFSNAWGVREPDLWSFFKIIAYLQLVWLSWLLREWVHLLNLCLLYSIQDLPFVTL